MSDEPSATEQEHEPSASDPSRAREQAAASEPEPEPREDPTGARRRRWLRIGVFLGFLGVAGFVVLPRVPRGQHVRVHLGAGSSRVVRATARISRDGVLDRETTFRFERGAPPSFEWEFEQPNGKADVELTLYGSSGIGEGRYAIELGGTEISVEAGDALGRLP